MKKIFLTAHIFFDDAFEISEESDNFQQVNKFVRDFMKCVWKAGEEIYKNSKSKFYLTPYKKIPTPYGGKLVYQLPGKTLLQVHLKDKSKIRHKKRWSQCMYLYYLLGHRLMENPELSGRLLTYNFRAINFTKIYIKLISWKFN